MIIRDICAKFVQIRENYVKDRKNAYPNSGRRGSED